MSFLTPQAVGERAVLKAFALQQFNQVRSTVHGLSDEQMHLAASASVFSPALMLQHITEVARHADIVRESIDGKGSYELNARVDGELAEDEDWPSW